MYRRKKRSSRGNIQRATRTPTGVRERLRPLLHLPHSAPPARSLLPEGRDRSLDPEILASHGALYASHWPSLRAFDGARDLLGQCHNRGLAVAQQPERLERALDPRDPRSYSAEYRVVLPGGAVRWVEARGRAFSKPSRPTSSRVSGTTIWSSTAALIQSICSRLTTSVNHALPPCCSTR